LSVSCQTPRFQDHHYRTVLVCLICWRRSAREFDAVLAGDHSALRARRAPRRGRLFDGPKQRDDRIRHDIDRPHAVLALVPQVGQCSPAPPELPVDRLSSRGNEPSTRRTGTSAHGKPGGIRRSRWRVPWDGAATSRLFDPPRCHRSSASEARRLILSFSHDDQGRS
jgi:hypothetical protein